MSNTIHNNSSFNPKNAYYLGTEKQIREILIEYDLEACPTLLEDGTKAIYVISAKYRKKIPKGTVPCNVPVVAKVPITFPDGDKVATLDGRNGVVKASSWFKELILYDELNQPRSGYFIVDVIIDGKIESHLHKNIFFPGTFYFKQKITISLRHVRNVIQVKMIDYLMGNIWIR